MWESDNEDYPFRHCGAVVPCWRGYSSERGRVLLDQAARRRRSWRPRSVTLDDKDPLAEMPAGPFAQPPYCRHGPWLVAPMRARKGPAGAPDSSSAHPSKPAPGQKQTSLRHQAVVRFALKGRHPNRTRRCQLCATNGSGAGRTAATRSPLVRSCCVLGLCRVGPGHCNLCILLRRNTGHPMAPTTLPSMTIGTPPSIRDAPRMESRRKPAPPAAIASWSALVGRRKSRAVRALPIAMSTEAV